MGFMLFMVEYIKKKKKNGIGWVKYGMRGRMCGMSGTAMNGMGMNPMMMGHGMWGMRFMGMHGEHDEE